MIILDTLIFMTLFIGSSLAAYELWKVNRCVLSLLFCICSLFSVLDIFLIINRW